MLYYVVLTLGVIFSCAFCILRMRGCSIQNLILKTISSLCFLLTGVFALINNPNAGTYGSVLIMGGALGLVGDILLDLKGIYKKDANAYLKGGFLFFLTGHLFYIGAIIYTMRLKWYLVLICALLSAAISAVTVASANIMKVHYGKFRRVVFEYVSVLTMTTLLSIASAYIYKTKATIILAAGAILFLLSDAILSGMYFGKNQDTKPRRLINHICYYAGQYLIMSSILFI